MKGTVFPSFGKAPTGFASHEVGTVRMGKDPRTSVLNSYCQARDVKNLFVTDGSCFTTSSEKNPPLPSWPCRCAPPTISRSNEKEANYNVELDCRQIQGGRRAVLKIVALAALSQKLNALPNAAMRAMESAQAALRGNCVHVAVLQ